MSIMPIPAHLPLSLADLRSAIPLPEQQRSPWLALDASATASIPNATPLYPF